MASYEVYIAENARSAAIWLLQSFTVNGNRGSSAWFSPFLHPVHGWSYPYPETTGYIIPTLYDLQDRVRSSKLQVRLQEAIDSSIDWLMELQDDNGGFPGGHFVRPGAFYLSTVDYIKKHERRGELSFFNTAQILRGLLVHAYRMDDAWTRKAAAKATEFLANQWKPSTGVIQDAYARETTPSYFTYAISVILLAWKQLGLKDVKEPAVALLHAIADRAEGPDGRHFIHQMGFQGAEKAHIHTVAYTLQGFIEAAQLLGDEGERFDKVARKALTKVFRYGELNKKMAGAFSVNWEADSSYQCITGNCQLALCYLYVYRKKKDIRYLNATAGMYEASAGSMSREGGIPGSVPFHGKYMSFRYPNWTAKYFLDLSFELRSELNALAGGQ